MHRGLIGCLLVGALLVAALCGCGTQEYEDRLVETAAYFEHIDTLNRNLGPEFSTQGVSIRPPKQFQLMPAPPQEVDEEGNPIQTDDPRQPHYLGVDFPGLLAAWEAEVMADTGGQDEPRFAYVYLLSNHERLNNPDKAADDAAQPADYLSDLETVLADAVGVTVLEGRGTGVEPNLRFTETVPAIEKYSPQKDLEALVLAGENPISGMDVPYEFHFYGYHPANSNVQVAVIFAHPRTISPQESISERIKMSLETLEASEPPKGPPGTAPSGF